MGHAVLGSVLGIACTFANHCLSSKALSLVTSDRLILEMEILSLGAG